LLREFGVADESVAAWLQENEAIEKSGELLSLYRLLARQLEPQPVPPPAGVG
jgi:hypothetical protein